MRKNTKYGGVIVPMVSPLSAEGTVDTACLGRLIDHLVDNGAKPFLLGTTGEAPSLSMEVRRSMVASAVRQLRKRELLFVGISNTCFKDSLEDATYFEEAGADVLVATPPAYYPLNDEGLLRYFEELADALPLPLMLYNMPATTKISIPLAVVEQLSKHPNIVGLKDSERDEQRVLSAIEYWRERDDFVFVSGWAASSLWALQAGADGIVPSTGNLTPDLYVALYNAALRGDSAEAQRFQEQTDALSLLYQKDKVLSQSLPALKLLLQLKDLCRAHVAPPLYRMSPEEEQNYLQEMKKELEKREVL